MTKEKFRCEICDEYECGCWCSCCGLPPIECLGDEKQKQEYFNSLPSKDD